MLSLENFLQTYYSTIPWEVKIISHLPKNNFLAFSIHLFLQKTKRFHKSLTQNSQALCNYPCIFHCFPTKKIKHLKIKEWLLFSMQQNKFIY